MVPERHRGERMGFTNLFFSEQKELWKSLREYLDHWHACVGYLRDGMQTYLEEGPGEQVDYYYSQTDKAESRGDELRRGAETRLYSKALLPESRGDILGVLEALDVVINRIESVLRQIVIERLEVETWMRQSLSRLVTVSVESCECLHQAAYALLEGNDDPVAELADRIDRAESRCDHLEDELMGRIFASDLDLTRKLQLKDFVRRLGTISDLAEAAADRIHIASLKRRV
jgi:predicted phosphate transport protein (TIGR00153 family)